MSSLFQHMPRSITLFVLCILFITAQGQDTLSPDGLFRAARKAAFEKKDYELAGQLLRKGLQISPGYADLRVFLGRIYTWTKNYDSASACFETVLKDNPAYEDASVAYTDLEYWNGHYDKALTRCDEGLTRHPGSKPLLLRKAKILFAKKAYAAADLAIHQLQQLDKNNSEAWSLANQIKENISRNRIGIRYDYVHFDKQFNDPWHLLAVDYGRTTAIGIVSGRVNYARRFGQDGVQFEAEAYPHLSKNFYAYINAGYSNNTSVFPQWRGGLSLYANLPRSFEGELGIRYLQFNGSPATWVYTAYLGKYYANWLLGARTYITPASFSKTVSASYTASARYYFKTVDDMVGGEVGYGISPDDRYNLIQFNSPQKLVTYRAGLSFKKRICKMNVLMVEATWLNQEYLPQTRGNQYQLGVGWQHRF